MRIALSLLLVLLAASLAPLPSANAQAHAPSTPIKVQGDVQLAAAGLPGAGTAADPYRLEWRSFVTQGDAAIQVSGTRKHLLISNVTIQGAGADAYDGIRLMDAQNVTIQHADIQFARTGILLQLSPGTVVGNSTIRAGNVGILLEGTVGARFHHNRIAVNAEDVAFRASSGRTAVASTRNTFGANELSIATGQLGFSFPAPALYDNDIDATNVVNFVPVRWYTHLRGTLDQPAIAEGAVYVKGVTNVGQIVCYNCSHVRFERNNATSGAASGIVIENGRNITIADAFAQGNEIAGIAVRNSVNVTVMGATLQDNGRGSAGATEGAGLRAHNVSGLDVAGLTASANRYGILVSDSGARIRGSTLTANAADGIFLKNMAYAATSNNTARANDGNGIRAEGGTAVHLRDELLESNQAAGAHLDGILGASVSHSRIQGNARSGVVLEGRSLFQTVVHNNTLAGPQQGIVFSENVALARAENNSLSQHARHIRFMRATEQNFLHANTMSAGDGQVGIHFDEESAYNNVVATSNTVGGTPIQWHVALVGRPDAPLVLRDLRVETANVTNVAQIMVYKSSYVHLLSPVAAFGPRGVYALRSSSLTIQDARTANATTGVDLQGTQTAAVRGVLATGGETGLRLTQAQNVTVSEVAVRGTDHAIVLDADTRGSVIDRTDASGARKGSVKDPTATTPAPRNLIADAGMDKIAGVGRNVTFSDALGIARYGSERIVRQTWTFGDGDGITSDENATHRPVHAYATPGAHVARYEIETADGIVLGDTVNVRIVPPPDAPPEVVGNLTPKKNGVALNWTAPPSEFPITGYTLYRGVDASNLARMLETVNNATTVEEQFDASMDVFYAVSASTAIAGEGPLSEPFRVTYERPPPPPETRPPDEDEDPSERGSRSPSPTPEPSKTPAPGWIVAVALAGVALALRRRQAPPGPR